MTDHASHWTTPDHPMASPVDSNDEPELVSETATENPRVATSSSRSKVASKRPGPRPMTDRETMRFEGQLFPEQHVDLNALVVRLTMENRAVPSSARRRFTLNSLVRIGAEIVLAHENDIHGTTESELLESLLMSIEKQPAKRRPRRRQSY